MKGEGEGTGEGNRESERKNLKGYGIEEVIFVLF